MGLLRLLLALSVVIAHSYPLFGFRLLGADLAVRTFFLLSGFYMALVLSTKYVGKNGSYRLFLTNRLLRIYPLYWVILFLTFMLALIKFILFPSADNVLKMYIDTYAQSPSFLWHSIEGIFRNITLVITTDYFKDTTSEPGHLLLLQAWTLQIEILFYVIAPFLVRQRLWIILALSIPFLFITFENIIPITNSITPAFIQSFIYFLMGILSYRLFTWIKTKKSICSIAPAVCLFFFLFALLFGYAATSLSLPTISNFYIFYYLITCISLPFIFFLSKDNVWDARIGDLSYPVYVSHFFIFKAIANSPIGTLDHNLITIVTIAATLLLAYILVKTIEKPFDKIRTARLYKHSKK